MQHHMQQGPGDRHPVAALQVWIALSLPGAGRQAPMHDCNCARVAGVLAMVPC
jgi:hypothetical protein